MNSERLFFGAQVVAPWPKEYPPGRMIPEETRHITLAFLGQNSVSKEEIAIPFKIKDLLPSVPRPPFEIGPAGIAKALIFLPKEKSRVAACTVDWLDEQGLIDNYQQVLSKWLQNQEYSLDNRPFFPHLSIARSPFDKKQWQNEFTPLPFFIKAIHLYQSMGNLQYQSLWEHPFLSPFEEFEHTADIAFLIRGHSNQEIHRHAQLALAFKFPLLIEVLYRAQEGFVNLDSARQSTIEACGPNDEAIVKTMAEAAETREGPVDLRSAEQVSEANGARREDRLGKAAASPNSQNLTERGTNSQLQNSLEEIIISLNELIATADTEFGCPFKAVSFHGTIQPNAHNILQWEMIVDV